MIIIEEPAGKKPACNKKMNMDSRNMKKNIRLILLIVIGVSLFTKYSFGQYETDVFLDKCASNLGTYNYINSFISYAHQRKKATTEYSYIFSKGSSYMMVACTENASGGKMVISLYDRNHNLIASTYDEETKKYYPDLLYPCSATGVYYIKATFEGTKNGCGMCILGFSKD